MFFYSNGTDAAEVQIDEYPQHRSHMLSMPCILEDLRKKFPDLNSRSLAGARIHINGVLFSPERLCALQFVPRGQIEIVTKDHQQRVERYLAQPKRNG